MPKESAYYHNRGNSVITSASLHVRRKVFELFTSEFGEPESVIDVGVTSEQVSKDANFFEKMFPHKDRITAVGIEDAAFLESKYPGLTFRQVEPNQGLPFADESFDVGFSHAVIEHVVDPAARHLFLAELIRVSRCCFITTPNKFFPIELHTKVPLIHFLSPPLFYGLLDRGLLQGGYGRDNLSLLSRAQLAERLSGIPGVDFRIEAIKLAGLTSNLVAIVRKRR